jgi:uncharacterized protein YcbX
MAGTVSAIAIAPVKGLGLVHPASVEVTAAGVIGDRRYALLDGSGKLANGKKIGTLVRVRPVVWDRDDALALELPDGTVLSDEVVLGEAVDGVFYGEARPARLVHGPWSAALSDLAGQDLRLVRMPDGTGVDRTGDGTITLQSDAALEALATAAGQDGPVDGRRFRMTFTIAGVEAHAEDGWIGRRVRVGGAVVVPAGNVGRCAITTQDPDTGIKTLDTLKLIADGRGHLPTTEPLPFGGHAAVVAPGVVAVGDAGEA